MFPGSLTSANKRRRRSSGRSTRHGDRRAADVRAVRPTVRSSRRSGVESRCRFSLRRAGVGHRPPKIRKRPTPSAWRRRRPLDRPARPGRPERRRGACSSTSCPRRSSVSRLLETRERRRRVVVGRRRRCSPSPRPDLRGDVRERLREARRGSVLVGPAVDVRRRRSEPSERREARARGRRHRPQAGGSRGLP